ncbi:hypothetical protein [Streptomyces sp. NPDC091212]|uniref:hypothetical protein n=1 Tax=Streptomyces sp. NPDC091212 TaxID=3155191 RepID=UPI00342C76CB
MGTEPAGFDFAPLCAPRVVEFEAAWQAVVRERANAQRAHIDPDTVLAEAVALHRAEKQTERS